MNEDYDALAAEFEKDTGLLAPGKDVAAAVGACDSSNYEYRRGAWEIWRLMKVKHAHRR